jgi:hypothetical protein
MLSNLYAGDAKRRGRSAGGMALLASYAETLTAGKDRQGAQRKGAAQEKKKQKTKKKTKTK